MKENVSPYTRAQTCTRIHIYAHVHTHTHTHSSLINRSLNSRRFSQFAPLVVQEITQPERTVTRALEPTSVGRSLDTTSSHPYYQHISTVMTTTDSTYTNVAPVGHRG